LIHGQLSPLIVPPAVIERTLTEIHHALPKTQSSFASLVLENLPADYYRTHNFVVTTEHHNLLLALRFPLSSTFNEHSILYEFQSFPVPVPGIGHGDHVTEITGLPYGITFHSISPGSSYLLFQTKLDRINNDFYYFTSSPPKPFRSFSKHDTCASALLMNDRQLVAKLCKFHLRLMSSVPSILPLTRSTILVTNISSLEYICDRRSVVHDGCLQCKLTIPCRCHLQIHSSYRNVLQTAFRIMPMQPFFTQLTSPSYNIFYRILTLAFFGNTWLHQPLSVSLPSFDLFRPTLSSQLARDHYLSYDLHRAVNATKQQETVFHSLAETLWRDSQILDNHHHQFYFRHLAHIHIKHLKTYSNDRFTASLRSFSDWYITWIIISVPLVVCDLLGVLFLFYRVRLLTATVTAAHFTLHKVATFEPTLPSLLTYVSLLPPANVSTPTASVTPTAISEFAPSAHLILLSGIVLVIFLVFTKFGFYPSNPNSFTLILEFGHNSIIVPIATQLLPGSTSQYTFLFL